MKKQNLQNTFPWPNSSIYSAFRLSVSKNDGFWLKMQYKHTNINKWQVTCRLWCRISRDYMIKSAPKGVCSCILCLILCLLQQICPPATTIRISLRTRRPYVSLLSPCKEDFICWWDSWVSLKNISLTCCECPQITGAVIWHNCIWITTDWYHQLWCLFKW